METQKLQTFVTVATTLNYTEAATRLFTTQATVSKQILSLEKDLGVTLFSRAHRQVALTASGKAILPKAQAVLAATNELEAVVVAEQTGEGGLLRIRTVPSISSYRAFNQIAAFHQLHPEVKLQIAEMESDAVNNALKNGEADIVFTRLFEAPGSNTEAYIGDTDEFVVVVPKGTPLAQAEMLSVTDLQDQDLLLLGESTHLFQPVARLFAEAGATPHITYKGQRIDLILGMVSRGLGISIMMAKAIDLTDFPSLKTVKLDPTVHSQLAFIRPVGQHSATSDAFWQYIHQH